MGSGEGITLRTDIGALICGCHSFLGDQGVIASHHPAFPGGVVGLELRHGLGDGHPASWLGSKASDNSIPQRNPSTKHLARYCIQNL